MAKANITTKNGTTIVIEGTAEEVAVLIDRFNGGDDAAKGETGKHVATGVKKKATKSRSRSGSTALITEMTEDNFFDRPRGLSEVKTELEVGGHHYPLTALSMPLLRLVKAKVLRRLKQDGAWKYVKA